jgi:hypothetical protein
MRKEIKKRENTVKISEWINVGWYIIDKLRLYPEEYVVKREGLIS